MNKEVVLGVCGLACSECPKYVEEKQSEEDCDGCSSEIQAELCPLPSCAEERGVDLCFKCGKFPCDKNYKGGPIVSALLDHWGGKEE